MGAGTAESHVAAPFIDFNNKRQKWHLSRDLNKNEKPILHLIWTN